MICGKGNVMQNVASTLLLLYTTGTLFSEAQADQSSQHSIHIAHNKTVHVSLKATVSGKPQNYLLRTVQDKNKFRQTLEEVSEIVELVLTQNFNTITTIYLKKNQFISKNTTSDNVYIKKEKAIKVLDSKHQTLTISKIFWIELKIFCVWFIIIGPKFRE